MVNVSGLIWGGLSWVLLRCGGVVYFLLDVCLRITFCCGLGLVGLFVNCGIWVLLLVCLFVLVLVACLFDLCWR